MRSLLVGLLVLPFLAFSQVQISTKSENTSQFFPIVSPSSTTSILYDADDEKLIELASNFLAGDIEKVTGKKPNVLTSVDQVKGNVIIIGSVGSKLIDQLASAKKIDVSFIEGDWERFIIQDVKNPFPGISNAIVIAGSDRRGTAYGVFTISKKIGVSPWHYWADVPAKKSDVLFLKNGRFVSDSPSVKYRGIFINDEAPALTGWVEKTYGSFNHEFYATVFEMLLRNKANYLWPAMWQPRAFAADDPMNDDLAEEYGIVMSTSHHEPMMRAHEEWGRLGGGEWDYETNPEQLREFWKGGIERMGDKESVVTMGMRGDGDEAMSEDTAVPLLQKIIADQREIIEDVTGKPAEETNQVWAIYKEVQDYYDKGMRVPDDILVLFCDDNWGNIRILPKKEDLDREGGYGIYYHFDFVGGPVSYRWLNVTQIERVWEQMNLAYEWGVKDLWIVNVGDIKPMELPISFFLDFGYDVDGIRAKDLPNYYVNWAKQQFDEQYATEIGEILSLYTKYNARRTPEMLKPDTYSLTNYNEADRVIAEYNSLLERSKAIYEKLPENQKDAFYQLVLSPVEFCSNLNEMYVAAAKNQLYASQQRASTNYYADQVRALFFKDAELTQDFHTELADGKWDHMMDQRHIGYVSWSEPPVNKMPDISYIQMQPNASLGYVLENGVTSRWNRTGLNSRRFLPFDPLGDQKNSIEIFNRGAEPLEYQLEANVDWINFSKSSGTIEFEEKVTVSVDWTKAPQGEATGEVTLSGAGQAYTITVPIDNRFPNEVSGFVANSGVVSINAANFTDKNDAKDITWTVVPNMGRTHSSIMVEPADAAVQKPGKKTPWVSYEFTVLEESELTVNAYLAPTLNYKKNEGLKYAVAIDDKEPQIINMHEGETQPDWEYPAWWNNSVTDHVKIKNSSHGTIDPGVHTLKIWMVDPGVVFQKFVLDLGGLKESYLGPPESEYVEK